jgi:hypothetical protein
LKVTRDTPLDEVRQSYLTLTSKLVAESDRLECHRFGGTVPSADDRAAATAARHPSSTSSSSSPPPSSSSVPNTDKSNDNHKESSYSYDPLDGAIKEERRKCLHVKRQRSDLNEAVLVIGDEV